MVGQVSSGRSVTDSRELVPEGVLRQLDEGAVSVEDVPASLEMVSVELPPVEVLSEESSGSYVPGAARVAASPIEVQQRVETEPASAFHARGCR